MRHFTPESATRTLPFVRRVVEDLMKLQLELVFRGDHLNTLGGRQGLVTSSAHADELADMRLSLQRDRIRIDDVMSELTKIGVQIHSPFEGAVDFPAIHADRDIMLCWKPGDETVQFWHEIDEGPNHRRPIAELHDSGVSLTRR